VQAVVQDREDEAEAVEIELALDRIREPGTVEFGLV
jgi:hypothetical protein